MRVDEFLDAGFQLRDAAIGAATDLFHGQLGEPALHETQPGAIRGRVVHVETGALGEPVADERGLMGAVVIHDDVHVEPTGHLGVNQIEEFPKLRRAVPLMKLRDHVARLRMEGGEQGRRPMPRVIGRPALDLSRLHRQQRLGAIEGLNLGFLIDAEHRRVRGRIQVEPDDVPHLLDQQRIVRQLKGLGPMGLQPKRVPNATDRGVTEPDGFRHPPRTPVRRAAGRRFQRAHDHGFHLVIGDGPFRTGPWFVIQPVQPLPHEPAAPLAHRGRRHVQPSRHDLAIGAVGARQDESRSPRDGRCRSRSMGERFQSLPFVCRQDQRNLGASRSHARLLVEQSRGPRHLFQFLQLQDTRRPADCRQGRRKATVAIPMKSS